MSREPERDAERPPSSGPGADQEHRHERRRLFSTFGYLIGTQGATAFLGLAYWPLATHLFSATSVGVAAAASSTASFLATVGVLGISTLVLAEMRSIHHGHRRIALSTAMTVSGTLVGVLAVGAILLSPVLGKTISLLGSDPLTATLFVAGAICTVAANNLDNAAIALRKGKVQLVRGVTASSLKIVLVLVFVGVSLRTSGSLVAAWSLGMVASVPLAFFLLRLPRHARNPPAERKVDPALELRRRLARRYGRLALSHHALNLSINSVSYILPVVAALTVLPQQVAYFSTAQVVASVLNLVPYLFAYALFAETANDQVLLRRLIRRTLPLSFASCVVIVAAVELAAPLALRFFGMTYSDHASTTLRLLIIGNLPYVVKDHYVAIRRAQGRLTSGARVLVVWTAIETAAGALGAMVFGLNGLCAAWVIAASVEGVALFPAVRAAYRFRGNPAGPAGSPGHGEHGHR